MGSRNVGPLIVVVGIVVVVVGVLVWAGVFRWFGRLPGDLRFGGPRARVYVPLASSIVLSVVLTVLVNLWLRSRR